MTWRAYKNELIVGLALLLLVGAFVYKKGKISSQVDEAKKMTTSVGELKEVVALKKVWGTKNISKKVDSLKSIVSPSKTTWKRDGKKLTASFKNVNDRELNTLVSKIMSLAVEIVKLDAQRTGETYQVELKCKW